MERINVSQQQWQQTFSGLGWNSPLPEKTWEKLGNTDNITLDRGMIDGLMQSIGWSAEHANLLWGKLQESILPAAPPLTPPAPPAADPWVALEPPTPPAADQWEALAPTTPPATDPWASPAQPAPVDAGQWGAPAPTPAAPQTWGAPQQAANTWNQPQTPAGFSPSSSQAIPAGWWRRFVAYWLDGFILGIITAIPLGILGALTLGGAISANKNPVTGKLEAWQIDWGQILIASLVLSLVYLLFYAAYQIYTQTRRSPNKSGETLGKQLLSVRVIKQDGAAIDQRAVVMREVVGKLIVYGLVYYILYALTLIVFPGFIVLSLLWFVWWWILAPVLDSENRCPHDKIAGTRPVDSAYTP